jgi:hypothetical protein
MCVNETKIWYVVATRHGDFDRFDTLEEAEKHATWLIQGYVNGTRSANDPQPVITECKNVARMYYKDKMIMWENLSY